MAQKDVTKQYLDHYAEIEAKLVSEADWENLSFNYAVSVPSCRESEYLPRMVKSLKNEVERTREPTLAIIVVNGRTNAPESTFLDNQKTLAFLNSESHFVTKISQNPPISLNAWHSEHHPLRILVIDRAGIGYQFPDKQGVGLARKIGCDVATALYQRGILKSNFIHTTDGDVLIPQGYFSTPSGHSHTKKTAAYIHPFIHEADDIAHNDQELYRQAMTLYDLYLKYYLEGLRYAGSPYAFDTIGSTIAIHIPSYAETRGFPKKEAGEDFYLLNKLAKVGGIEYLAGGPLRLRGRPSDRVPFGTGASILKIAELLRRGEDYTVYDPICFEILKLVLNPLASLADHREIQRYRQELENSLKQQLSSAHYHLVTDAIASFELYSGLEDCLKRSKNPKVVYHAIHTWFDAFKTLKLIHHLRDQLFPSIPIAKAVEIFRQYR